ncbi:MULTISPECIES: M16 family metallopeptidase [Pelosinus]|uniref:Peptidase M16 domain protein n=1 Tax=Pelosinus fermentans B4 TaxID=1149862 RepID=I8RG34_9FIRM|nr:MULTISPECIES: pitrilysin family protein [Pelosinus]EIW18543.1 peptidase M16 domain protein [Pelosinus fermentans B4]EIW24557.1 peptidase M16 domain protein [Pelosinus fermentans A11]OAM94385.1 processing peptidase [Pelosinus fermentans DSM 17108]SDR07745.1 Predicted Zn-dependent peptidase [Pelosinus fermentans]
MYCKSLLPNGIRVVSEAIPYVKSVTLGIWIGTGSRFEQKYNHGISHFIEHMVFKGTENRSAKDIAETVDGVGGQINAFTTKEHTCYYIKVLDTHLELALAILSDMLRTSIFTQEDIKREKEVVLEEICMYEDTPDELVHDLHHNNVWAGHALGHNIIGTTPSVENFNKNMILEYYQSFYTPDNIVIAGAGKLSHERLEALVEYYFGNMTGQKKFLSSTAPNLIPAQIIQSKNIEQVHICLGTASVPQTSPDIYTMHILNTIVGGGISSRLFQSIREEQGLAYSIYSYQTNYSDAGLFTIYAGTRPSNASQVIELIIDNINTLRNVGINAVELAKTKEQLKGSLLLSLESSSSRMFRIGKMELTLGSFITLDEVVDKIDKVTLENLHNIIHTLLIPDRLAFTVLGPVNEEIYNAIKRF